MLPCSKIDGVWAVDDSNCPATSTYFRKYATSTYFRMDTNQISGGSNRSKTQINLSVD